MGCGARTGVSALHGFVDNAVEVEAAWLLEGGGGLVVEEVPGFAVVLVLVEAVAGADADGLLADGTGGPLKPGVGLSGKVENWRNLGQTGRTPSPNSQKPVNVPSVLRFPLPGAPLIRVPCE
jgi:hypothetical protein